MRDQTATRDDVAEPSAHDLLIAAIAAVDVAAAAVRRKHARFTPVRDDVDDALALLHRARANA